MEQNASYVGKTKSAYEVKKQVWFMCIYVWFMFMHQNASDTRKFSSEDCHSNNCY